jgi:uncharacterized protein (UPF0548 family)
MFLPRRPALREIERFLDGSRGLPLSYSPLGLAADGAPGFRIDEQAVTVGHGPAAFERAASALAAWKHFELGWLEVFPKHAPLAGGTTVAVLVRHLGFYSLNGCRIVTRIQDDHTNGYAYGTLANHAECGEESFTLTLDPATGAITYAIRAASRPQAPLARLGYPFTRALQARFRRDSARALARAVKG